MDPVNNRSTGTESAQRRAATPGKAGRRPGALLPVLAPAMLVLGGAGGVGLAARLPHGGAPQGPPPGHAVGPRSSFGGTLEARLRRLRRESEASGEVRVSREELEQMLEWCRRAREERAGAGTGPAAPL